MAPSPMSELIVSEDHPSDEALNLTAGSKRPSQDHEKDQDMAVPVKKRKKVNFNLTLNLTATREPSESPELLLQRVPPSEVTSSGSDLDEQIPTTPGGRLQVERETEKSEDSLEFEEVLRDLIYLYLLLFRGLKGHFLSMDLSVGASS